MRDSDRDELLADDEGIFRKILKAKGLITGDESSENENLNPNRLTLRVQNNEIEE